MLTAEWKSPSKIVAISGPGKGLGDVIVSTKLGGIGTCNVKFKGKLKKSDGMNDIILMQDTKMKISVL